MPRLHLLDYLAIGSYFLILLWVGYRVMRAQQAGRETESFMAADRDMDLLQTTASTAATDLGGGFASRWAGSASRWA